MSHPQPKRPSSKELIEKYSVAGTRLSDLSGSRVNTGNRHEAMRQVNAYR